MNTKKGKNKIVTCPFCNTRAAWVENKELYGRNYGKSYMMYLCKPCDAYVGCHQNSRQPLGSMADKELRELRKQCHALLDPLWKNKEMSRQVAYALLYQKTGTKHIGWTDKEDCLKIIQTLLLNTESV